jgi:hypothetical protein
MHVKSSHVKSMQIQSPLLHLINWRLEAGLEGGLCVLQSGPWVVGSGVVSTVVSIVVLWMVMVLLQASSSSGQGCSSMD